MKNTFGSTIAITIFGESHGPAVGAVLDGLPAGLPVDPDYIRSRMDARRPSGAGGTARSEADEVQLLSGVFRGRTTGTPLALMIENRNARPDDYADNMTCPRPGHGDYTAHLRYGGFEDFRGGGHMSGRLTAALTAAGAIAQQTLEGKGIAIRTRIASIAGQTEHFEEMIEAAVQAGNSLGGILQTTVTGIPAGVGEPWFDTVEGMLSHAVFSIPAVKAIEFGDGFSLASMRGTEANDCFTVSDGRIVTSSNHNGGISGGITNGMPLLFTTCIRPTPSVRLPQHTVDLIRMTDTILQTDGRHDACIVMRAPVILDSVTALVLCDLLASRYGSGWLLPDA